MDHPGGHKSHLAPIPYLGGTAILTAVLCAVALPVVTSSATTVRTELLVALGVAMCLAIIGIIDDVRTLPFMLRFGAEGLAAVLLWVSDVRVAMVGPSVLNFVITILWVVGVTNAFNLLDNMDGLSAGIAGICCSSFFAVGASNDQFLVAGLAAAVAGSAIGFLRHNFHPAKIYMGDGGALFFGFMVAYLGLKIQPSTSSPISYLTPIVIVSIAVLDTSLVTMTRLINGLSPFRGGRDHISHRLVKVGLPVPVAVGTVYAAAVCVGTIGFVVARGDQVSGLILATLVTVVLLVVGVLLARVPVYGDGKRPLYRISRSDF